MVLTAPAANNYTNIAIDIQSSSYVQREVDLAERSIRNAANRQQFQILFNARIIGNPVDDPQNTDALTPDQKAFRDTFVNGGYLVSLDTDSGLWRLSWASAGAESVVSVYSVRTTVTPGAVSAATIAAINEFFNAQIPVVTSKTSLLNVGPGGDTDEGSFGGTTSVFYEYIATVQQQDPLTDYSTALRTALTQTSLGYINVPSNVVVIRLA